MESTMINVWTKQQIDKELRELAIGGREMGGMDAAIAFDVARIWIDDNPGARAGIEKHYKVIDVVGFVANNIC